MDKNQESIEKFLPFHNLKIYFKYESRFWLKILPIQISLVEIVSDIEKRYLIEILQVSNNS